MGFAARSTSSVRDFQNKLQLSSILYIQSIILHFSPNVPDVVSGQRRTPLQFALSGGWSAALQECVVVLLDNGADVNVEDGLGWTALHCAAHTGNVAACQVRVHSRHQMRK